MENLENDVKKAQLLSDEELKEVAGGKEVLNKGTLLQLSRQCEIYRGANLCIQQTKGLCAWVDNKCMPDPNKYEYVME